MYFLFGRSYDKGHLDKTQVCVEIILNMFEVFINDNNVIYMRGYRLQIFHPNYLPPRIGKVLQKEYLISMLRIWMIQNLFCGIKR